MGLYLSIRLCQRIAACIIPIEEAFGTEKSIFDCLTSTASITKPWAIGVNANPLILDLEPLVAVQNTGSVAKHVTKR